LQPLAQSNPVSSIPRRDVFASIARGRFLEEPYPHLVVEDALPADLATVLLNEMPPIEVFTNGAAPESNKRFYLRSWVALADPRLSQAWKAALAECNACMGSVLSQVLDMGDHLLRAFPDFTSRFAPLDRLRAVPRAQKDRKPHEIGFDAQMVINTPALSGGSSVRGPHLDKPDKLISGLLYLRAADDNSTGGELELYAPRHSGVTFDNRNNTGLENVEVVHRYPYRHNLLILPLGVPHSLHGVTPRSATSKPRYHLHIVGETAAPLFTIPH
jgi:hypothetical protein